MTLRVFRSFCSHVARESIKLILFKFKNYYERILIHSVTSLYWFHDGTQEPKYALRGRVNCRPVYVGFVVNRVALGHVFLRVLLISIVSSIQPRQHIHAHLNFSYSSQNSSFSLTARQPAWGPGLFGNSPSGVPLLC